MCVEAGWFTLLAAQEPARWHGASRAVRTPTDERAGTRLLRGHQEETALGELARARAQRKLVPVEELRLRVQLPARRRGIRTRSLPSVGACGANVISRARSSTTTSTVLVLLLVLVL